MIGIYISKVGVLFFFFCPFHQPVRTEPIYIWIKIQWGTVLTIWAAGTIVKQFPQTPGAPSGLKDICLIQTYHANHNPVRRVAELLTLKTIWCMKKGGSSFEREVIICSALQACFGTRGLWYTGSDWEGNFERQANPGNLANQVLLGFFVVLLYLVFFLSLIFSLLFFKVFRVKTGDCCGFKCWGEEDNEPRQE